MEKNTEQLDRHMTPAERDALEWPPSQPMTPQQAAGILRSANLGGVLRAAADMGIEALERQGTQKELDRSRWEGCSLCKGVTGWTQDLDDEHHEVNFCFCPVCGRPITDEAYDTLVRRIGGNDGTTD